MGGVNGWRWMKAAVFLVALTTVLPVGARGQSERPADPPTVELAEGLDRVLRDYEVAWGARDADGLAALFTEDGYVLRPGYPPAVGRDQIRAAYARSGGPLSLRAWDWAVSGDVGWIIGGYSAFPDGRAGGKFVLALRRDASGRWLIAADMDNGSN